MTRHSSPNNQVSVPVLDQDGKPVSPTRPSRARRWLESGRAIKVWKHGMFAVQLTDTKAENCVTPEMSININPGDRTTGMAVMLNNPDGTTKVIQAYEIRHRGHKVTKAMLKRASHRNNRRGRIRRRPARFNNRARKKAWTPPSTRSKLANTITTVRRLIGLFPIREIKLETYKFDPRLMQDPNVFGAGYQISERGHMQVREYVLQRDNRTCQYRKKCRGSRKNLQVDHIVAKSKGGPYRVSNLITACGKCNEAKSNQSLDEFLAKNPERLKSIRSQLKKSLASATHMNQLMPLLVKALEAFGLPLLQTDAVTTAYTRNLLGVDKTHANDAACLGEPTQVTNIPERVQTIEAVGHGKRQMLWPPSEFGTPRYDSKAKAKGEPKDPNDPYRTYCRLGRSRQGYTTPPGHRNGQRRTHGITPGDIVRYEHPKDGAVTGYGTFISRNTRVRVKGKGGVKTELATLIARGDGYRRGWEKNITPKRWEKDAAERVKTPSE